MIRNNFLDLVKDGRAHKRTEPLDGIQLSNGSIPAGEPITEDTNLVRLIDKFDDDEVTLRAYKAVEGELELKEYLDAVLRDGYTKRSHVAHQLGITIREATLRRDRLKTRLRPLMRSLEAKKAKSHRA